MQKVDIAIAVAGVIAVVATGLGIAYYDDLAGIESWTLRTDEMEVSAGPEPASSVGPFFTFDTPLNATRAAFEVTVRWTSPNPGQQGAVQVTVLLEGPDGSSPHVIRSAPFSDGSMTVSIASGEWAEVPSDFRANERDLDAHSVQWNDPIRVRVHVDGPSSTEPLPPLPGLPQPSYEAETRGVIETYHAVRDLPDPHTG